MDSKILEFAALLRKTGITVSHSEVAEALEGLAELGLERDIFYNVLSSTLIKDQADFRAFDKLFEIYFNPRFFGHRQAAALRWPELIGVDENGGCTGTDSVPGAEHGRTTGFGQGQGLATAAVDSFVQVIKVGDPGWMREMVKRGVKSLGRIKKEDLKNISDTVRQVKVFLEWNMGTYELEKEAPLVNEEIWLIWQERLMELEEILYRELEQAMVSELGSEALETVLIRENVNQLDFYRLSVPQVAEIRKKISKLAHKLASRLSFRHKKAKHGKIDLYRTIRKSMAYGGVPISPAFRDRYPTRPQIVVLCDLSGSVKVFSEFMLQLVYSIQSRFVHVRSFVFVDTPDDVTGYFQNREIADGIRDIYNWARFSKTAFSDYGLVFIDFWGKYRDVLDKKTTLIIIGDARNNYNKEHADYFQKICGEVRKTVWLNPEPAENWDMEDSIMSVYGRHCSQVFECRNLEQLDRVVRRII